ncbi:hypothetical protein J6590_083352 [Homalodisca vitripennis]|nr:hypothetical protein J6590_083352 [Homalodisca vitripennis]
MAIWYALMDIAGVNARIIYQSVEPDSCEARRLFLVALGKSLIHNQLVRRSQMTNIPRELKETVQRVSRCHVEGRQSRIQQHQPSNEDHRPPLPKRQRCHICPRVVDKRIRPVARSVERECAKLIANRRLFASPAPID